MRADAALRVVGSRCTVLRSAPPFAFRETNAGVMWVGSAAGPLGGDQIALDIDVQPGGSLALSSVAAGLVHPGPSGEPSKTSVTVRVGAGGSLHWAPRPTVLVRGCDHEVDTVIEAAPGASVTWREEVVLGRHQEESGSLRQRLVLDIGGRPLLRTELLAGPRYPASLGPAGTNGARAVGSLLLVGPRPAMPTIAPSGVRMAIQLLRDDVVLVTAVAERAGAMSGVFDDLSASAGGQAP